MLAGNYNAPEGERLIDTLLYQFELHSINMNPTCYKNPNNPSKIDFILTNCSKGFFKTDRIFTGLSGFHKLVLSVFKTTFTKSRPNEIVFRNYRKFNEKNFNQDVYIRKIFTMCKPCTVCYKGVYEVFHVKTILRKIAF